LTRNNAGEFNTDKNRGAIISWVSIAVGLSSIVTPVIALWILSYEWSFEVYAGYLFRPWRLLLIIYALPGVIGGLWLCKMPESPKFLLSQGRNDEALKVVQWIYVRNRNKSSNIDGLSVGKLISESTHSTSETNSGSDFKGA